MHAQDAALLDALLEDAPIGFAFYTPDRRYLRINRHLAEINRVPVEAHLGRAPSELLPAGIGAAVEEMLDRVLRTGRTYVDQEFSAEVATVGSAGREVRHWRSSWYPARRGGETLGVAVLVLDVTDQMRADERLRWSRDRALRLLETTSRLGAALTVADVDAVVEALAARSVGAVRVTLSLVAASGNLVPARNLSSTDGSGAAAGGPLPQGDVAEALGRRQPVYVAGGREALLPLLTSGAPLGLLRCEFAPGGEASADDRVFLEALAGQCAQALDRARLYEQEHRAAVVLQRSLLPSTMPSVAGFELAARYCPGAVGARVGGDWYDAFAVPDGRLALVLGDMMGKGVAAAAGMGRLRSAVRTLALLDPDPRRVLTSLDQVFASTEADESLATVVLAVVDKDTGEVHVADAGHLPLLLLRTGHPEEGQRAVLVDASRTSTPLGWPEPRTSGILRLDVGDVLVAFSDGLVESRTRPVGEGLELMRRTGLDVLPQVADGGLEMLCDRLVSALTTADGDDDVTLLAVRRVS